MILTRLTCAALALLCLAPAARAFDTGTIYGTVRGWTVVQGDKGCSAFPAGMPVILNTPPAGGWQLVFPYASTGEVNIPGIVDVDKVSFDDSFYGDGQYLYGSFEVEMRKIVGAGSRMTALIGDAQYDIDLTGSTAALLKVEECWQNLSGWTPASSRAGTFAFK